MNLPGARWLETSRLSCAESCRESFADHVGDTQSHLAVAQWQNIVVVAAHDARRLPGGGDFVARDRRNFARQQAPLDVAGLFEFEGLATLAFALSSRPLDFRLERAQELRILPGLLDEIAY